MKLPVGLTRFIGNARLTASAHAPEICMVAGTVELVVTVVTACKAAVKFQDSLKAHKERIEKLDEITVKQEEGTATEEEAAIDVKADRKSVHLALGMDAVKEFAVPAAFFLGTVLTYAVGFKILKGRYVVVSGALAKAIKENRFLEKSIEDKYGSDALAELKGLGTKDCTVETHVDPETGETVVDNVKHPECDLLFTMWFDASNPNWNKTPRANWIWLKNALNRAEYVFRTKGHLFVNELLTILGYEDHELLAEGDDYGWLYYKDSVEAQRHGAANYISIGIPNTAEELMQWAWAYNDGRDFLLHFNVDPEPIRDKVRTKHARKRDFSKERIA